MTLTQEIKNVPISHRISIIGQVIDAVTQQAIAGAQVELTVMPQTLSNRLKFKALQYGGAWETLRERPDRTQTRSDGYYYFQDLPSGEYGLKASWPIAGTRYGIVNSDPIQVSESSSSQNLNFITLALPPTGITGEITVNGQENFIAKLQIKGRSDYRLIQTSDLSDNTQKIQYSLTGIEAGKVELAILLPGYKLIADVPNSEEISKEIIVEQGKILSGKNFTLNKSTQPNGQN